MPGQAANQLSPLKGNEAVVSKKLPGYEIVEPVRQPKDLVSYRDAGPGVMDPIANAENQLQFIEDEFRNWLSKDCAKLNAAWSELKSDPANSDKFIAFHKAVHTIAGNAAILNCACASQLAKPLARMLERRPTIENHLTMLNSAVQAICAVSQAANDDDDPRINEIENGLSHIVERWIARRR